MNKVKMAIVGAGIWGENHARIYNAHPFAEVVALCDMNLEKAREVAARVNIPQVYSDYNEMFEKSFGYHCGGRSPHGEGHPRKRRARHGGPAQPLVSSLQRCL